MYMRASRWRMEVVVSIVNATPNCVRHKARELRRRSAAGIWDAVQWSIVATVLGLLATSNLGLPLALGLPFALVVLLLLYLWRICLIRSLPQAVAHAAMHSLAVCIVLINWIWHLAGMPPPYLSLHGITLLCGTYLVLCATHFAFALYLIHHYARQECQDGLSCHKCGYRVDNIPSANCPECGVPVEKLLPLGSIHSHRRSSWCFTLAAILGGITVLILSVSPLWSLSCNRSVFEYCLFENPSHKSYLTYKVSVFLDRLATTSDRPKIGGVARILGNPDYWNANDQTTVWVYKYRDQTQYARVRAVFLEFDKLGYLTSVGWNGLEAVLDAVRAGQLMVYGQPES